MSDTTYSTDRIVSVQRMRNSASGNPRYRVTLGYVGSGVMHKTAEDAQVNYGVEEHVGQLARIGYRNGEIVSVEATTDKDA